jgi:hypothetical protein
MYGQTNKKQKIHYDRQYKKITKKSGCKCRADGVTQQIFKEKWKEVAVKMAVKDLYQKQMHNTPPLIHVTLNHRNMATAHAILKTVPALL